MATKVEGPGGSELIGSVRPVAWIKRTPSGAYLRTAEAMEDIPESEDWSARGGWEPLYESAAIDAAVAAEREQWQRIAAAAQAVTEGAEDIGDFLVSSSLMSALALALDEGPNV